MGRAIDTNPKLRGKLTQLLMYVSSLDDAQPYIVAG